jgi:hypothetical protein
MNDGSNQGSEDLPLSPANPDIVGYKWGWSEVDGEIVWDVGGTPDGLPSHQEQLTRAWKREPDFGAGDILGRAAYERGPYGTGAIVIEAYYGADVPKSVVEWFRNAFPDTDLVLPAE